MLPYGCCVQMREGEGPSYFNPLEASTLVGLVVGLLQVHVRKGAQAAAVSPGDVGVIATYRKQARLLCCPAVHSIEAAICGTAAGTGFRCHPSARNQIAQCETMPSKSNGCRGRRPTGAVSGA